MNGIITDGAGVTFGDKDLGGRVPHSSPSSLRQHYEESAFHHDAGWQRAGSGAPRLPLSPSAEGMAVPRYNSLGLPLMAGLLQHPGGPRRQTTVDVSHVPRSSTNPVLKSLRSQDRKRFGARPHHLPPMLAEASQPDDDEGPDSPHESSSRIVLQTNSAPATLTHNDLLHSEALPSTEVLVNSAMFPPDTESPSVSPLAKSAPSAQALSNKSKLSLLKKKREAGAMGEPRVGEALPSTKGPQDRRDLWPTTREDPRVFSERNIASPRVDKGIPSARAAHFSPRNRPNSGRKNKEYPRRDHPKEDIRPRNGFQVAPLPHPSNRSYSTATPHKAQASPSPPARNALSPLNNRKELAMQPETGSPILVALPVEPKMVLTPTEEKLQRRAIEVAMLARRSVQNPGELRNFIVEVNELHTFAQCLQTLSHRLQLPPHLLVQYLLSRSGNTDSFDEQKQIGEVPMHQAKVLARVTRPYDHQIGSQLLSVASDLEVKRMENQLRTLISVFKVKVEDANDLVMAIAAVKNAQGFFADLQQHAAHVGADVYSLWRAMSS